MKAVTLRHPWPYAFTKLGKSIENRAWVANLEIGERYAIHAGKAPRLTDDEYWGDVLEAFGWMREQGIGLDNPITPRMVLDAGHSAVVAVVNHEWFVRQSNSPWFTGPVGWESSGTIVLPQPVPCRGAQGLWTLPADVAADVRAQMEQAA